MEEKFKYYMLKSKNDQAYPLLRIVNKERDENGQTIKVYLEINTPVPSKPVFADFLYAPETIVSQRTADAMQSLNMEGVRFIPTELTLSKGEFIEDYVCVLVDDNMYVALDKEKSIYEKGTREWNYMIEKAVLDREVLSKIPLSKRLSFRLREAPGYHLFHQSVIEIISALNPTGVFFVDTV